MGLLDGMILVLLRMADTVLAGYNDFLGYGCPTRTVRGRAGSLSARPKRGTD